MKPFLAVAVALLALPSLVAAPKPESFQAYAEWHRGHDLIVDGQQVTVDSKTRFKNKGARTLDAIPLGYEVNVSGTRLPDGRLLAIQVEAKPNGNAMFEGEVRQATDQVEAKWMAAQAVTETDSAGKEKAIGPIVREGGDVTRATRILGRLVPPYVNPSSVRLHVVDTKDWNAMAMGNGSVWIFTGLLHDMNDDEVAIVVGHELCHYTHEHSRKQFKSSMWLQLAQLGILGSTAAFDSNTTKAVVALAGTFSLGTLQNGYSRNYEDQADRVGLRYAYEGGYDVTKAPGLWRKFEQKYGSQNSALNFFLGDHPTAQARIANLDREIALNYKQPRPRT